MLYVIHRFLYSKNIYYLAFELFRCKTCFKEAYKILFLKNELLLYGMISYYKFYWKDMERSGRHFENWLWCKVNEMKWTRSWDDMECRCIYILHTHALILISLLSNSEIKFCKKYFSLKLDPLLCCNFLSHHHHSNINIFVGGKWN